MIPRLKPAFGPEELVAALRPVKDPVRALERGFARIMETEHAVAFEYGRSGIWALLTALGVRDAEVVMPAYTCVVVPHAVVESGNIPVFVDCEPGSFNMSLEGLDRAITDRTRMVIPTHIFGYPMDTDAVGRLVGGRDIFVLQDCAHSFGASFRGAPVAKQGHAAVFGSNVSKMLSTIFGGFVTTDDPDLARRLMEFRDREFNRPGLFKSLKRFIYFCATYPVFWPPVYTLVNMLEEASLLDGAVRYYDEAVISMPGDYRDLLTGVEARVGLAQLGKYEGILARRRAMAERYAQGLAGTPGLELPPLVDGATYSHFVCLAEDRERWLARARRRGVQLGRLIEYSIPEMKAYREYSRGEYPIAGHYSERTVNLPIWPGVERHQPRIIEVVRQLAGE